MANEKKTVEDLTAKATPGTTDLWPFWDFVQKKLVRLSTTNFVEFLSQAFVKTEDLADVATSGQYDDLEGLPVAYTDEDAVNAAKENIGPGALNFAAGNHTHSGFITADPDGTVTRQIKKDLRFDFTDAGFDLVKQISLTHKIRILNVSSTAQISSVAYYVRADSGSYVSMANYTAINSWITTNMIEGDKYWIKVVPTPVASPAGPAEHIMVYQEIA
jgi:hypothetical protein